MKNEIIMKGGLYIRITSMRALIWQIQEIKVHIRMI